MRVAKKHDVRLNEILDAAGTLFTEKGYENTSVNDILDKTGISKGALYHYFDSKEEVMDGVIRRTAAFIRERAAAIAGDSSLSAHEKMKRAILAINISENISGSSHGKLIDELHKSANALMHQKSIALTIQTIAPVLTEIVEQGIREGIYKTPYPLETMEFLLAAGQFIFDEGIFQWSEEELQTRVCAFVHIMELSLGAPAGSFHFLLAGSPAQTTKPKKIKK
ncbi:MAG: TetR/AcrR family transcriptional regulator [Treponema sp.]|nr:TetR/AcrR family transcriptional regulator [Treponema sp.]